MPPVSNFHRPFSQAVVINIKNRKSECAAQWQWEETFKDPPIFFSQSIVFGFFPLCSGAWHRERGFSGLLGRPPSPRVFAHAEPQGDNFFMFTAFSFIIFICCWVFFFWWSFFCCLDVVACVFVLTSVQVPFPACPGGIDVLTTTSYFPACPGDMEIVSGDGPLPMAIFELLEYIVNEVMGRTPW